jgi:hypothetical protein
LARGIKSSRIDFVSTFLSDLNLCNTVIILATCLVAVEDVDEAERRQRVAV